MENIHATCVSLKQKGILLLGKSGTGKSDLALRLIEELGAKLVSDDRTNLFSENNNLYASCPKLLEGLLEVRGIGIIKKEFLSQKKIDLVVDLVERYDQIERLPDEECFEYMGIKIPKIKIYPFEASAIYKIKLACDEKR